MRVRRELRSLSAKAREAFFDAVRLMRKVDDATGGGEFGPAYRSYDYLLLKHAMASMHRCIDQGHLAANQIIFHRALLLEFELSVLAVVEKRSPDSGLEALPYWDWRIDLEAAGDLTHSSLWHYWGSPFGDPKNDYCIIDPFFNASVPTSATTLVKPETLADHAGNRPLGNGYGFWRNPWSLNKCSGVARNPGWALNKAITVADIGGGHLGCWETAGNFVVLAECLQGQGYSKGEASFGFHNLPHIYLGTFDDGMYGPLLAGFGMSFCAVLLSVTLPILIGICSKSAQVAIGRGRWIRFATYLLVVFFSLGFGALLEETTVGPQGLIQQMEWSAMRFGRSRIDHNTHKWLSGELRCPLPGTCQVTSNENCGCWHKSSSRDANQRSAWGSLWPPVDLDVAGSDFWDSTWSPNDHIFYPIHAFVDMLHFSWADLQEEWPDESNHYGGVRRERVNPCSGTGLYDVVSEDMCFTAADVGLSGLEGSGGINSKPSAHNANQSCLTMEDLFYWSMGPNKTYSYDRVEDEFVWRGYEPRDKCPEVTRACSADVGESGTKDSSEFIIEGHVQCESGRLGNKVPDESCNQSAKPPAPRVTCSCEYDLLRQAAQSITAQQQQPFYKSLWDEGDPAIPFLFLGTALLIWLVFSFVVKYISHQETSYEMLFDPDEHESTNSF